MPTTPRMVLLQHDLPDGSSHVDWMIEGPMRIPAPPSPEDRCLITFRLAERIDRPLAAGFEAERLEDHRRVYLDYEGSLSGQRGTVTRLAAGVVSHLDVSLRTIQVVGQFGAGPEQVWRGTGVGVAWVFERAGE